MMNSIFSKCPINQIRPPVILTGPELPLITPRLVLRDFTKEDTSKVIAIASHPNFSGYLRFRPEAIFDDVTQYLEEALEAQKPKTGYREIFRLAICLKEDPSYLIGCCVFHGWNKLSEDNDQIGYFIHPNHQGQGFATEAVEGLLTAYFSHYPVRNVEAIVHPENIGSQKVLKKLGFIKKGEKMIDVYGMPQPRLIYSTSAQAFKLAIMKI